MIMVRAKVGVTAIEATKGRDALRFFLWVERAVVVTCRIKNKGKGRKPVTIYINPIRLFLARLIYRIIGLFSNF